jgi:TonB family protein
MKLIAVVFTSAALLCTAFAQSREAAKSAQEPPVIVDFPPAAYPPIALAARVSGQVELKVAIRLDGSVASAEALSGPAMLLKDAIESAKQMRFDCAACSAHENQFRIDFKYELSTAYTCDPPDPSYPRVLQSAGVVTFIGQPAGTCDPSAIRVRSAKCLYLWKCGWR